SALCDRSRTPPPCCAHAPTVVATRAAPAHTVQRSVVVMRRRIHPVLDSRTMTMTRRELGKLMLTVPAAGWLSRDVLAAMQAAKPNSKWAGVQVGLNVPYNYGPRTMPVDEVINRTVTLGVSAVELRSQ